MYRLRSRIGPSAVTLLLLAPLPGCPRQPPRAVSPIDAMPRSAQEAGAAGAVGAKTDRPADGPAERDLVGIWHSVSGPGMWEIEITRPPRRLIRRVGPAGIGFSDEAATIEPEPGGCGRIRAGADSFTYRWDGPDLVLSWAEQGSTWTFRRALRSRASGR